MIDKRLQELRAKHNYTQKAIGDLLNMTPEGYGHYESGKRKPSPEAISKLARFYKVSSDYLLGSTDDSTPPNAKKEAPMHDEGFSDFELNHIKKYRCLNDNNRQAVDITIDTLLITQDKEKTG